jgi:hypothetical protein
VRRRKCSAAGVTKNAPNVLWLPCNATPAAALANVENTKFTQNVRCNASLQHTAGARCANVQNTNPPSQLFDVNIKSESDLKYVQTSRLNLIFALNECIQYRGTRNWVFALLCIPKE